MENIAPKKRGRPRKIEPSFYEIVLTVDGKMYSSSGESMQEALDSLPRPPKIFLKGSLMVRKDERSRTLPYTRAQILRLYYPLAQKILAKQLAYGL